MNFRRAMKEVEEGRTVKVMPNSEEYPFLVKVDYYKDETCLLCRCLTKDGTHLEPDLDWEPVCYLLCFEDYLDGEWEVVDADDYRFKGDDE